MIRLFLALSAIFIFTNLIGQNNEFRLGFSSGLFSFSGESSTSVSFINHSETLNHAYTNNPYGSQQGLCYGLLANWKRVSKKNFVFGMETAFESVRSKVAMKEIGNYNGTSTTALTADGKTFLSFNFINFQPFTGYRLALKKTSIDVTAGIDIAFCLRAKENGEATATNGTVYETFLERKTISTDIRPRLQISTGYKSLGAFLGYSFGQTNYRSGYIGATFENYSNFLRFGLTWLLK